MCKAISLSILLISALVLTGITVFAQTPSGIISGTVTDESGAVIANSAICITNKTTGTVRTVTANAAGIFSASALDAGQYEVRAEITGFRTTVRDATVTAGNTTTVDMAMRLGDSKEVITVEAASAQINYESHTVAGTIPATRFRICRLMAAASCNSPLSSPALSWFPARRRNTTELPLPSPSAAESRDAR